MGEKLQECINDFVAPVKKGNDILNMHGGIDQFIYLVKECYADMICILALHLSLADYLQAFISNLGSGYRRSHRRYNPDASTAVFR